MYCKNCGNYNSNENNFCIRCGTKLEIDSPSMPSYSYSQASQDLGFLKFLRNKVILALLGFILILSVFLIFIKPPSVDRTYKKVKNMPVYERILYLDKVYPLDGGFLGLFQKNNLKRRKEVRNLVGEDTVNDLKKLQKSLDKYPKKSDAKIEKLEIDKEKSNSNYRYLNIRIRNNGDKPIRYIKINLYFKSSTGSIVGSDWTNDSSTILPGAMQTITTMVKSGDWNKVSAEIDEVLWKD